MARWLVLGYGTVVYAIFFTTFCALIGFVGNWIVPKSIDSGPVSALLPALAVNGALILLFGVQHAIMARPAFKAWWTKFVPQAVERSTFVLCASAILIAMMVLWRPVAGTLWQVEAAWARALLSGLSLAGWGIVLYSTFLIDHFDLFGLRQAWFGFRGLPYCPRPFMERSLYRWVRHPLMLGFLIAFWATPDMTAGHLMFAGLMTLYIVIGTCIEERDLAGEFGEQYEEYRQRTGMFFPRPGNRLPETGLA